MLNRLRSQLVHRMQLRESWVIFFIIGIIMMNFPFLNIFNRPETIFGFPLLYLYLYLGWGTSILVIYLFINAMGLNEHPRSEKKQP